MRSTIRKKDARVSGSSSNVQRESGEDLFYLIEKAFVVFVRIGFEVRGLIQLL